MSGDRSTPAIAASAGAPDGLATRPDGLAILVCHADPARPDACAAPFLYASTARAMDVTVEVYFTAAAVRLLVEGVAETLMAAPSHGRTVRDCLEEATRLGATLHPCATAQREWVAAHERLVALAGEPAGATAFVGRAMDPRWRTLVF